MKIGIYVFSGTGNTRFSAELMKKEFEKQGCTVDLFNIEDFSRKGLIPSPAEYDIAGFGYPVHAWNAPRNFFEFIGTLPPGGGKKSFVFKSAGDPLLDGGATSMVRARLLKRGYEVFHETLFVMPANVMWRYSDEMIKDLIHIAERTAAKSVTGILKGDTCLQRNGILRRACSRMFSAGESFGVRRLGRRMKVSDACNNCGVCVKICPMGNIAPGEKKPVFLKNCVLCVRCIDKCPKDAITPLFKIFKLKERYDIGKIMNDPSVSGEVFANTTKGFFKRYRRYFEKQGVL
ncbi:MAG: hypothetical protein A2Y33_15760 [Spirochaetes bacterium GWF1_51_8]|nr:MAG: hypothetical protein A2Y33_15760 [Spirochaetes bacterium GWF1_51_8]